MAEEHAGYNIIGGGTAGSVLASHLTNYLPASRSFSSMPTSLSIRTTSPSYLSTDQSCIKTLVEWNYKATTQAPLDNQQLYNYT
jgi:hypothetical protein